MYVSNAAEAKTYIATVGPKGELKDLEMFVERGGESVASDSAGRLYVAKGEVFVYGPNRVQVSVMHVPGGRPLQLLVDGPTLFIFTHHSVYTVSLPGPN